MIFGASCRGDTGDRPRKLPDVAELKGAKDIFERSKAPAWDWKVGMQAHCLTWTNQSLFSSDISRSNFVTCKLCSEAVPHSSDGLLLEENTTKVCYRPVMI